MIVWLASYPRSGNSLVRTILRQSFGLFSYSMYNDVHDLGASKDRARLVGHVSYSMSWDRFYQIASAKRRYVFVKTHDPPFDDAPAIYIVRDGRSAIVSYRHYFNTFGNRQVSLLDVVLGDTHFGSWSEHIERWKPERRAGTLLLRYEDIVADPDAAVAAIADRFGISALKPFRNPFDHQRQEFPEFFRRGRTDPELKEFDRTAVQLFSCLHGAMMSRLGYRSSWGDGPDVLRQLILQQRDLRRKRDKELGAKANELETHKKAQAELCKELGAKANELETHKKARAELCKELDAKANELRQTQTQLAEIETSTSFQVGRAFVDALVRPFPGVLVFPSRLARIALHRKQKRERKLQEALQHVEGQVQQAGRQTGTIEEHRETAPQEDARISVVMTTYNSAEFLSDAIRSVLDQSHRNLELIVVDDASTDGTFEMLREHARVDNRVRPFKCLENRGTYWCKNFGITKATGTYLTFQDSDDVSDPNRLDAQLKELRKDPNAVAATCNYVRSRPNGQLVRNRGRLEGMAIMAPMFKKDAVLDTVGYYDSVRTSADDEMFHRLRQAFGTDKIRHVDRPLYVASHREGSRTTGSNEIDLSIKEKAGSLSFLSPDRRKYVRAYQEWHKSIEKGDEAPYMAFPLLRRRFPAPDSLLIDAKPAEEYVTASVASFAAREDSLKQAVASILPQIDRLNVYLNNYDAVPEFLRHPKITVARSQEHGDLRDNGKFFFLRNVAAGYHFTIDDDIIYPPNYVQHLILKILQYRKQAMVGIHGVTFADPIERFYKDRKVLVFWEGLDVDWVVNLLGSGTVAYHTSTVELDFKDFKVPGMGDLWLAVATKRQKVPMIAVARAPDWLMPIQNNDPGLYEEFLERDGIQTDVARLEAPWGFQSWARSYCSLANHFISKFSTEALRSNEIDVEFWQSFSVREQQGIKISSQSSAEGRDSSSHSNIADKPHFNEVTYWIRRHGRMREDPRSVGSLSLSAQENRQVNKELLERFRAILPVLFPTAKGRSALDLACGVGRFSPTLVEMGFKYTGVDISPVALEQARGVCPLGSFCEGNIVTYRPPQTYDLVIAVHVLIHLVDDADWQAALDTIAASIDPDGLFLLIDDVPIVRQSPAEHVVNRSLSEYDAALAARNLFISDKLKQQIVARGSPRQGLKHFHFIKRMS